MPNSQHDARSPVDLTPLGPDQSVRMAWRAVDRGGSPLAQVGSCPLPSSAIHPNPQPQAQPQAPQSSIRPCTASLVMVMTKRSACTPHTAAHGLVDDGEQTASSPPARVHNSLPPLCNHLSRTPPPLARTATGHEPRTHAARAPLKSTRMHAAVGAPTVGATAALCSRTPPLSHPSTRARGRRRRLGRGAAWP